jgi:hypothetical protein
MNRRSCKRIAMRRARVSFWLWALHVLEATGVNGRLHAWVVRHVAAAMDLEPRS